MITQNAIWTRLNEEVVDLSSDEEEPYDQRAENVLTLFCLNNADYISIQRSGRELRGSCIQAVNEIIHRDAKRCDISSVSTDFYSYLTQNKKREAKRLLHPDNRAISQSEIEWATPKTRQATAESRILLIPCHIVESDKKYQQEMRHWILVVRLRVEEKKCK